MKIKKKIIILLISANFISLYCYSQNAFIEKLTKYYDVEVSKTDSLYNVILSDTLILSQGTYNSFMDFVVTKNLLYKDTIVSVCIITKMKGDSFRKSIGLSNEYKTKILTFISDVLLNEPMNSYFSILPDCLFDYNFWESGYNVNDNIQYNERLLNNLTQIIQTKSVYLRPNSIRLFKACYLEKMFPYVIDYVIKPYFESPEYKKITNYLIWSHLYQLAKVNNQEVLPYLYKALSESGCEVGYSMRKYTNAKELTYIIKDNNIKKNIYINLLKDDCITKLIIPTIDRDDTSRKTYFDAILDDLEIQYNDFPIEEIRKLNTKKQVEFVEKWIKKNI
jgi:hypothetical protein